MPDALNTFLRSLIISIVIGLGGLLIAALISMLFARLTKRTWTQYFGGLVAAGLIIWTIKLVLDTAGAIGVIVILGTAVTAAISLGSEHVASDLVAGIKLFFTRPFKAGDYVTIAGQSGIVEKVKLTYTILLGYAGDHMIIRNSDIVVGMINSYAKTPAYLIQVDIAIPANQDLEIAIPALEEAVKDFSPETAELGYYPSVFCGTVQDGYMLVTVYAYISTKSDLYGERTRLMRISTQALKQKKVQLFVRKD